MNLIPLYVKTDYSILSSLITIDELISKCIKNNISSIAITDENTLSGAVEFYNKCRSNNIKPIIGVELAVDSKKILLYAKNYNGYNNLTKLVTRKTERDLNIEDLKEFSLDVLAIIPFQYKGLYNGLKNVYTDLYLGYETKEEKKKLYEITSSVVYLNETLVLEEKDQIFLSYANLIRDGKTKDSLKDYKYNNKFLKTDITDVEIKKETKEIEKLCQFKGFEKRNLIPKYINKNNLSSDKYLEELAKIGLSKRLNNKVPKSYAERLFHELEIIKELNFSDYFLIVSDYVTYAKKNNVLVGPGRGSAAGSLVSYSLGITEVDPIKYNLLFERFLNPERITMPDIDIDFEDEKRDFIIDYVKEKYGSKNVANIITFGTLGAKQVIRDVGRVFELPTKLTDRLSKYIPNKPNSKLIDAYNQNQRFKDFIKSSEDLKDLFKICLKLEHKKRHTSLHAAGVIISAEEIDLVAPLIKEEDGYVIGYTMDYLEQVGLLKMDFLALKNLTIISNVLEKINQDININQIDLNDKKVLNLFKEVKTSGIFQFEKEGMKTFLNKLKINNFEEIVAAIALYRPGPMDNIDNYINNRSKHKINLIHEDLRPILENTYGIIVYQEQIMQIANLMASYSLGEADVLRRAMSKKKKQVLMKEEEKFISRSIKNGYEKEIAEQVYEMILKFANYGFNRAHSVSYSVIAYQLAFLKTYYPLEFMSELLNSATGSENKIKEYVYESRKMGITIKLPSINESTNEFIIKDNSILYPLNGIKSIGHMTTKNILEERKNGKYIDFFDFVIRTYKKGLNEATYKKLIEAGIFDEFGINRQTLFNNLANILNYADLVKDLDESMVEKPNIEVVEEYQKSYLIEQEYISYGFYINNSPFIEHRKKDITSLNYKDYFDKQIEMVVQIEEIRKIKTKKNDDMAFVKVIDEFGELELVVFPSAFNLIENKFPKEIIRVTGTVQKRAAQYQVIINDIVSI